MITKMNLHSIKLFFLVYLGMCRALSAQQTKAVIAGDFADPSIIRKEDSYYAIGTSSEWAPHFPIFKATDLNDWQQVGFLFEETPAWTKGSFWAPEYYFHNGTYYVYYTARRKSDGVSCIGVATSKFPDHGFKDHGILIEYGSEAIDAFVFNDDGQLYISWKAYGLDKRPIEILGSKLAADGLSLAGAPFTMLRDDQGIGIEGQSILKKDGYYYLFYSGGACCGLECTYHVSVARASTITGPYENFDQNPILSEAGGWKCPGHGTFVEDKEGKTFYMYHAYSKKSHVFTGREGQIAELRWKDGWPVFASAIPAKADYSNIHVDFAKSEDQAYWQWDFRYMQPRVHRQAGELKLSGKYDAASNAGIALTLRPYSASYQISTSVLNNNKAEKGLIIYGDEKSSIGVSAQGENAVFWVMKDGKKQVLAQQHLLQKDLPVYLKMQMFPNFTCKAYWKQSGDWKELVADSAGYAISFLPPWDRSPRPGLHFKGPETSNASFQFFDLTYLKE
ncbi:glycoside hydrolase family 43 protein [Olivibacter sp. XZL3]|uniref:glycoside hydrolase family 43 protein n=1 Tax=Olivibacter sp. XZL3 TaxID=1735116 RepID=UPI0010657884|nr:glycoside hydrolase family 43 protein [Olivibacter sp. XZL3]